ncbi:MAG: YidC/Oxa1 family membrane protein insertase [Eubacteriales bacterium]
MDSIVDIIRIPFGYMLEMLYNFTGNYGLALICFGVAIKLILLPVSMKSKKSMMKMSRMAPLTKALEAKYGDDKAKYQAEVMKLYKEEGVSTTGGCLWSFIPLLILIPLYQVIREPMVYMMHLSSDHADIITALIAEAQNLGATSYYQQMAACKYITQYLPEIQAAIPELANVAIPTIDFSFLGLDMGSVPAWQFWTFTSAASWGLFAFPMVSGGSNWLTSWITQKFNNSVATDDKGNQVKDATASSMKTMMYMMPLMSIWIGFQMPAGMSVYWITQAIIGVIQEFFLSRHYRKFYDQEDEVRREKAAEAAAIEAAKEAERARRRALNPEGYVDPNTSKKKLAAKEKANKVPTPDRKLSPEELEAWRAEQEAVPENQDKHFSGIADRPNCRGRSYRADRYGKDTSET